MQLLMLIDLNMNPSPQDGFIVAQDRSFLKPRWSGYGGLAAKLTGEPSLATVFRYLSASRLVTIAQIEGRVRGVGSEFVLACDMRFAAHESAI
jgi:enoyl-CoA hydratase/carnithine racemase